MVALLSVALAVGTLVGAVGVGGILLIPALTAFAHLDVRQAMATALFTFIFTGITGTVLFQRKGTIDWRVATPVCAGALVFAFAGAWANSLVGPRTLTLLLAVLIIFAGLYTLASRHVSNKHERRSRGHTALLAGIGSFAGFGSGLTGVGGPALSVPLMMLFGFPALMSIGASQVIQVVAAVSGTIGNLRFGSIDFALAAPVTVVEIAGVFLGSRLAHAVNHTLLRRVVGLVCIPVAALVILNALGML
ncbi:MAG: sulfite exporter TauE/SafE family protein [Rhodospirillaceae bacterium]